LSSSANNAVLMHLQVRGREYKRFLVVKRFDMELSYQIEMFFNTGKLYFELRRNILFEGELRCSEV
jgi:hypothetical protein